MNKPNFRKAIRRYKASGKMFSHAYPRNKSGTKCALYISCCILCETLTIVSKDSDRCKDSDLRE